MAGVNLDVLYMKRILTISVLAMALFACSKDKFKTEPTVEIKSFGPESVVKGEIFTLRANVTDKEGDLQDSVLLVRKRFSNNIQLGLADTLRFFIKDFDFPDNSKIEIAAMFSYGEILDNYIFQNLESNTDKQLSVGIIVRDKAGNKSPYVESQRITLKKL